jgi:hypothetical protein
MVSSQEYIFIVLLSWYLGDLSAGPRWVRQCCSKQKPPRTGLYHGHSR